jgi:KEOPS complex subunit Cgi121
MNAKYRILQAVWTIESQEMFLETLRDIADRSGTRIVCFNADSMAGEGHVRAAIRHAWRSWSSGNPISNSFEMEALLYAAGSRQCQEAAAFGIHAGVNRCYIVLCPARDAAQSALTSHLRFVDEDWEQVSADKQEVLCRLFGITGAELAITGYARLKELVEERVALLDVYR